MGNSVSRPHISQKSELFGRLTGVVAITLAVAVTVLGMSLIGVA